MFTFVACHPISAGNLTARILALAFALLCISANSLAATVTLAWDPSPSANVAGYKVHYGSSSHSYSTNIDTGNRTSFSIPGLAEGTTYYFAVTAYDATRTLQSAYSNEVSAAIPATAPTADFSASQTAGMAPLTVNFAPNVSGAVTSWSWDLGNGTVNEGTSGVVPMAVTSYPNSGTYTVSLTVTGPGGTAIAVKPAFVTVYAPPVANFSASVTTGTAPLTVSFTNTSLGNIVGWLWNFGDGTISAEKNPVHTYVGAGTYTVSLTVSGPAGSVTKTNPNYVSVASASSGPSPGASGLVAAFGFEEATGTTVTDSSGMGNHGVLHEAVRTAGRFGKALKFDGLNDLVTIADRPSLDVATAMTLEAWVYPTEWMNGRRMVILKEGDTEPMYALHANTEWSQPAMSVAINGERIVSGVTQLPPDQWTHLAATYDGQYQRLYLNGTLVSMQAQQGVISPSVNPLTIGGSSVWGNYFRGQIDEVRIYNRALTEDELAKDSAEPIGSGHTVPSDLNGDGKSDLAGLGADGSIWYTTNLATWLQSPGQLSQVVTGDFNGDGKADLGGVDDAGAIGYTTNLGAWTHVPGRLSQLASGDFDGDGKADLAGVNRFGAVFYTTNLGTWINIPGTLSQLVAGDLNGDGKADLAGVNSAGAVFYTTNLKTWINIPGTLSQLVAGDLNGDGRADLAAINGAGAVFYSTNLRTWINIPGTLNQVVAGDLNGDAKADLVGHNSSGAVFYTTNLATWANIPGTLNQLRAGDFNGDGRADLCGITITDAVFYTTNLATWTNIAGALESLADY